MKSFAKLLLISLLSCACAWAQGTAQLHGTVKDATGAAVPGANVKATQTETGISRTANSGADGEFVLTNLPLGPYQVEVSKEGFTKYLQSGIVLQVNSDPSVDAALKVGAITEQVSVEANAAQVETRNSGIGEVVQTQRIVDLPLNGRNVTDLVALTGATVTYPNGRYPNMISIAGQPSSGEPFGTDYFLDGANHINYQVSTTMPLAFPDAVQEFKVESSGQLASHGASAAVTVVTRSGTNNFHGNLFEFIRNSAIGSAREYFSPKPVDYKRNQYGGTFGGPIKKNKLFFFFGFQGTDTHQNPDNSITNVPTAAVLAGNWTAYTSVPLKAPFVGNMINPALYSAPSVYIANKLLQSLAASGVTPSPTGLITYNTPAYENDLQFTAKFDYQLNDKQSIFFRGLDTHTSIPADLSLTPNILNAGARGSDVLNESYAIGHTYIVNSSMVQSFRAGFERSATNTIQNFYFDFCQAGVQMWCGAQQNQLGGLIITGGFTGGGGASGGQGPSSTYVTSESANDDVNWVKGSHQIAFGGGLLIGKYDVLNDFAGAGQFTFNGTVTGLGMADFMTGQVGSFIQGLPNIGASGQNFMNLYATDSWRINPRLTFNFGLRWEPYLPMSVKNGTLSNFNMSRFLAGSACQAAGTPISNSSCQHSTVFVNAPYGFYFPGDPGFPGTSGAYNQWTHFDPRGGLAWDPRGDGKMSIRAGFAYGYAYIPGVSRLDQAGFNPWGGRSTYTGPFNFATPYATIPGGNPLPYTVNPNVIFTQAANFMSAPYNLPSPTTYSWNFSVQRQMGATWIVSSTYLGSRVQHLDINQPINYAEVIGTPEASGCAATALTCSSTANTQVRRVLSLLNPSQGQYVGQMDQWQPAGTQIYHGLLTSVQKRFSHGVSASGNWTWSHCIGLFQGYDSKADQTSTMYGNLNFDRGNCDADRRHIVNITVVELTPKFSNRMLRTLASDWQISGIYKFISGMPIAIQDGTGVDRELSGISHQRPNEILSDPYTGLTGPNQPYFNASAFALPALGNFGDLGWNSVVGPTFWEMDMALSRIFHIRERHSLEIRADAFNLTNSFVSNPASSAQPGSSVTNPFEGLSSNLFGINNAAQATRKIQFALKYAF